MMLNFYVMFTVITLFKRCKPFKIGAANVKFISTQKSIILKNVCLFLQLILVFKAGIGVNNRITLNNLTCRLVLYQFWR